MAAFLCFHLKILLLRFFLYSAHQAAIFCKSSYQPVEHPVLCLIQHTLSFLTLAIVPVTFICVIVQCIFLFAVVAEEVFGGGRRTQAAAYDQGPTGHLCSTLLVGCATIGPWSFH